MEDANTKVPTETVTVVSSGRKPSNKRPKSSRRTVIIACVVSLVAGLLMSSAGLGAAFLLGRTYNAKSIEQKRQTVVEEGDVIADVAQKVGPSIVSIVTQQQSVQRSLFYGDQVGTSEAAGTGMIIDASGYVLTNKHVVPEGTTTVKIVTSSGVSYGGVQIVGRDPLNDIAILKVPNPKDFTPVRLADSDKVRTGQKVIAIGNALGEFQNTVTSGIISGKGRPIEAGDESGSKSEQLTNLFQTDAAINSGNSGGPLLNFNGEVIGMNTAVASDAENIGFAIPINEAKGIIDGVKATGKVSRPYIGVRYTQLNALVAKRLNLSVNAGAYINTEDGSIVSGSPAEKAGLQAGDIITKVEGITLTETSTLTSVVSSRKVGDTITLTVLRSGKTISVKVTLAEAPAN